MAKPRITIVGLGLIGNSIGLALGQAKRDFEIVGHDRENNAAGLAKKLNAVDKTDWNLINACDGADLVILALPAQAIRNTMQVLAGELKPGCVVIDTASIKVPIQAWADELLPDSVRYVGTNPIVASEAGGGQAARADLFERATWAICPSPTSHEAAVRMATDLVERLGAKPLYLEAVEHDGMMAAVEHLPGLLSSSLLHSVISQPSWREMRKLAGGQFESSTHLVSADPNVLGDAIMANRENLLRWLDLYIEALEEWRDVIESGDESALYDWLNEGQTALSRWQKERRGSYWDEGLPAMPEKRSMLATMFGFGGRSRPKSEKP